MFDTWVVLASRNSLIKGGVLAAAIWWAWFNRADHGPDRRSHVLATILGSVFAIALARGLALGLPFRTRPLNETALDFTLPYGMGRGFETWSSFPSDHAVLFVTLSVGLLFVSRMLGTLALIHSTAVILLPRIYLGLHYPTDVLAGAALGALIAWMANKWLATSGRLDRVILWSESQPRLFYPAFFLLTYQLATLFDDSRAIAKAGAKFFKGLLG